MTSTICIACCWVDMLAEVDVLKHTTMQLEASIVDKERDIQRRVQAVREEEWQKLHRAESEKYDTLSDTGVLFLHKIFSV